MSIKQDFLNDIRKNEYDKQQAEIEKSKEGYDKYKEHVAKTIHESQRPLRRMKYELNVAKNIMCECFARLYIDSIPVDNAQEFSKPLTESAYETMMNEMSDVNNKMQFKTKFENASPYIKNMAILAEAIAEAKADSVPANEEFPDTVMLDKDDIETIRSFENVEGEKLYADALQDRVVDVYKAEAELSKDNQEKTQAIVDKLTEMNNDKLNESVINTGLQISNNKPSTLFHSIFMNKSKHILNEAGTGADLNMYSEDILVETLCTYTLLECIHSLGIRTISSAEREKMKTQFIIG